MKIVFDRTVTNDIDLAIRREWLETNGLGGWASSTIIGLNSRRQHGLLVAATQPPTGQQVLLSKLDETLITTSHRLELGCNAYPGVIHPNGDQFLESFEREFIPTFTYHAEGIRLQKRIFAVHGENTTVVLYDVLACPREFTLELQPFIAARDLHGLTEKNERINPACEMTDCILRYQPYAESPTLQIKIPDAVFSSRPDWYLNFEYVEDMERGQDFQEDLYCPGTLRVRLQPGALLGVVISTDDVTGKDAFTLFEREIQRRRALIQPFVQRPAMMKQLALAADQFLVRDSAGRAAIINGYPWHGGEARETMIAVPGLCLATGRHDAARDILLDFARTFGEELTSSNVTGADGNPRYHAPDGILWFFIALHAYRRQAGGDLLVKETLYPRLKEIVDGIAKGGRFGLHVEDDGLLAIGAADSQLTWNDIQTGDSVVAPRRGKTVELNALWYNALRVMAEWSDAVGLPREARKYEKQAGAVSSRFNEVFWNEQSRCLYDLIDGDARDEAIRPHQIFAISLPFPLLVGDRARRVLDVVDEHLFTPLGLRSLSTKHPEYRPTNEGDLHARVEALCRGAVWSWLLGPYLTALMRTCARNESAPRLAAIRKSLQDHLQQAGIGTVSEVFNGQPPHKPGGCIATAAGVGEVLRVLTDESSG